MMAGGVLAKKIDLSIIIVNYKSKAYLRSCLMSILKERDVEYEIIVVDNASGDGSTQMVESNFPNVCLIKNMENLGFAKANNIALKHASGKYILLLNPDTELTGNTLKTCVSFMEKEKNVAAAGCKVIYPDGRIQISCGKLPGIQSAFWGGESANKIFRKLFPDKTFVGACGISLDTIDKKQEVENLLGAFVIIRKDVFSRLGYFDENMFVYFEESDLFHRIKKSGEKVMYIPETTVIHHAGGSTKSVQKAVEYYHKSQEYYLQKNYGLKNILLFRLLILASAFIKMMMLFLICRRKEDFEDASQQKKIMWHWNTFLYYAKKII